MGTDDSNNSLANRVEGLTKLGLPLLALIYITGFIVVALNLARYGISPLSLIRVQYIVAGIWLLLPLGVFATMLALFSAILHQSYIDEAVKPASGWRWIFFHTKKIVRALVSAYGIFIIASLILKWVIQLFPLNLEPSFSVLAIIKAIGLIMVFGIAIGLTAFLTWASLHNIGPSSLLTNFRDLVWGISFAALAVICILGYIGYFTYAVYGKIPSALGGGAPMSVQFILKTNGDKKIPDIIQATPDGKLSVTYSLLLNTDKTYIIIDPNNQERAIEISKDSIDGVVYNVK